MPETVARLTPAQRAMLSQLRGGSVPLRRLHKSTVRALELRGLVRYLPEQQPLREVHVQLTRAGQEQPPTRRWT